MSIAEDTLATLLKWEKLPEPVREYRFAPPRRWRFDFAWPIDGYSRWPQQSLAVEVEGGSWVNGAHTRGRHFESDCEKYNEAALRGWRVLRVTPAMVEDGRAVEWVKRALAA